ncbi:MarR family winged helix-turn-helix transcriptional regulator [Brevibacterium album]|uniref:MarR family winged helix-turn-helix transcriptional regulator n=1 Tax=Brevibacterium album TaxID=417948 RepID=UPI0004293988|nr:MarR family transcriptional regulator [Brevibacterium album]
MVKQDRTDEIIAAWRRVRPDLDASSVAIVTRLWQLAHIFGLERRQLLAAKGIDPALMDLLGTLRRSDPTATLSTRELAGLEGVTPAAISQRVARAEGKGWVTRESGPGRSVLVTLTPAGQDVVDDVAGAIFDHDDALLTAVELGDRETLADLLRTLCLAMGDSTPVTHVGTGGEAGA